jgi:hypothetical protein
MGGGGSHKRQKADRLGSRHGDGRSSIRARAAGPARGSASRTRREAPSRTRRPAGGRDGTRPPAAGGACASLGSSARRCHRRDHQSSTHRARRLAGHRTRCIEPAAPRYRDRRLLAPFPSGLPADRGPRGVGHRSGRRPTDRHVVASKSANASAHSSGTSLCTACASRTGARLSCRRLNSRPARPRWSQTRRRPTRSAV